MSGHILSNFVLKLFNDTALTAPGGRLFQSFITRMLKKGLRTLFLRIGFFSLNLNPLVKVVLSTLNNTFSDSFSLWRFEHVTSDLTVFLAWYIDSTKTISQKETSFFNGESGGSFFKGERYFQREDFIEVPV